jgi:hypothetical protein
MGALGGFAAGLAGGYKMGESIKNERARGELDKRRMDNEDKRVAWQEEIHNRQKKEWKEDDDYKQSVKDYHAKFLEDINNQSSGPSPAPTASNMARAGSNAVIDAGTVTDEFVATGAGGAPPALKAASPMAVGSGMQGNMGTATAGVPRPQKTMADVLQDPALSIKYMRGMGELSAASGKLKPEDLVRIREQVGKMQQSEDGKIALRILSGDLAAKAEYEKAKGWAPGTVKIVSDPKTFDVAVTTPDGNFNASAFAYALGGAEAAGVARGNKTEKQGDTTFTQNQELFPLKKQAAQANIAGDEARTNILIPAQAENLRNTGRAAVTRAAAAGNKSSKAAVDKKIGTQISSYLSKQMTKGDPHAPNAQMIAETIYANSGGKMSPQQAAAQAAIKYNEIIEKLQKQGKNKALLEREGVKNSDELIRKFFASQQAPATDMGDTGDEE